MKNIPDEPQLEQLLETIPPETSDWDNPKLASAPWTHRAASRRRTTWIMACAVAAMALLFSATPPGRAWAQSLLSFFYRTESDTLPMAVTSEPLAWVDVTPGVLAPTVTPNAPMAAFAADCGDYPEARCSVEQIRSKVAFPVTELGTIPAGLYFTGATGGPTSIMLKYQNLDNTEGLTIFESPWTGSTEQTSWPVGASAEVKTVQIGDVRGEYVRGSFLSHGGKGPVNWDPTLDIQTIHWVKNEVFIEMEYSWGGAKADLARLVSLAESLTNRQVSASLPKMPATATPDAIDFSKTYPLTIDQGEQYAGFQFREPERMPAVLLPAVGAVYDNPLKDPNRIYSGYHVLTVFYPVDPTQMGPSWDGLLLHEELLSDPYGCALCGFRVGTSEDVWADKGGTCSFVGGRIKTVRIGEVEGQYVEGVWTGKNNNGIWFWETSYGWPMRLRWQTNGMAFELEYHGPEIEKTDLIAIAESIK